jgi:nitroreductase
MNNTLKIIDDRVSLRWYDKKRISSEDMDKIIKATLSAPSAGNMMMYSIIHIKNSDTMKKLSESCDSQPFIKTASDILIFVADFNKWNRYYEITETYKGSGRRPGKAEMIKSFEDTMIASTNAVIAAESLGIGSCYIGDILEHYELHKELFNLPNYTIPIAMLTLGYYPEKFKKIKKKRFEREFMVFEERYKDLDEKDLKTMFSSKEEEFNSKKTNEGKSFIDEFYTRKTNADFMYELEESVDRWFKNWK